MSGAFCSWLLWLIDYSRLRVERGIVCQRVDDVKTSESQKSLHVDSEMLDVLKLWKQTTQFSGPDDWLFASPYSIGRLPWSYDQVWRTYHKAAVKAELDGLSTHSLRHSYRSWLDAVGTPIAVQQKLMRHSDIGATMNVLVLKRRTLARTGPMRTAHLRHTHFGRELSQD